MPLVPVNGIDLYYEERGSGEPLLLIMGITAAGSVWEKHAAYWENSFRCIIADNRGVGLSGKPAGPYSTELMADDYAGLLDALQVENVRVVGCSMGSAIAQQLALRHPGKVKSLVLMCPWARCDNTARAIFQHMMDCKARLRPEEFILFIQLIIFSKPSWDNDQKFHDMVEDRKGAGLNAQPQPLHGLEGQAAACMNHDVVHQLKNIKQPALVMGGSEDVFTPLWMAEEVAGGIPNAELYIYEKSGHAFHWEQIEDFNPRVLRWLIEH
jgi:pimeloyl-ACP methyl ester carboxylesterase